MLQIYSLAIECDAPLLSFSDEGFRIFGVVNKFQWQGDEYHSAYGAPDLSGKKLTWRVEESAFQYFRDMQWTRRGSISQRHPDFENSFSNSKSLVWIHDDEAEVTLSRPKLPNFETFIMGVASGRLGLSIYIPMLYLTHQDGGPTPTKAAVQAGEPLFGSRDPSYQTYAGKRAAAQVSSAKSE